jgi:hypothetical protein
VRLFRTTLVHKSGAFVADAVTPRSARYDGLRRATAGCWYADEPDLSRYSAYRAAVIVERQLQCSPAMIAAAAAARAEALVLNAVSASSTQIDGAVAEIEQVVAAGFPSPLSVELSRRLVSEARQQRCTPAQARWLVRYLGRRSGSLCQWCRPVPAIDIAERTDPVEARLDLLTADLRPKARPGRIGQVLTMHGLDERAVSWRALTASDPARVRDALRPLVIATVADEPTPSALYALQIEVEVTPDQAASSVLERQPVTLRQLAPAQDHHREYLLPGELVATARVVRTDRIEVPGPTGMVARIPSTAVQQSRQRRRQGIPGSPFHGFRSSLSG